MTERHAALLQRLADAAERLALKHAERALSSDDPAVEAQATGAFHKAARCARQCVALEARLLRDADKAGCEDRQRQAQKAAAAHERRKGELRARASRRIWTEADDPADAVLLDSDLDDLLDLEAFAETFLTEDIEVQVARLLEELGVTIGGPPGPEPVPMAAHARAHEGPGSFP